MTNTAGATDGIFNFEGGCYAKTHQALRGSRTRDLRRQQSVSVLCSKNVVLDARTPRAPDFDDGSKTENTRSAYPLDFIPERLAQRPRRSARRMW